ncbi:hypothetical protein AB0M12_42225 [Nocardia vinacea]|uniref:hypothetical protein n=1 Tax=Nocardia vinacea TaxID=96468 RepID=UPI0034187B7F
MVARTDPINQAQLDVLRWVDGGCPDGVMTGNAYKVTARALEWRGLVVLSKRGGVWRAEVTDAGRYYVEHGRFPDYHWVSRKSARKRASRSQVRGAPTRSAVVQDTALTEPEVCRDPASVAERRPPSDTIARVSVGSRAAAQKLIDELIANKQMAVHQPDESALAEWRKVVDFAKRHKMIPDGCRVERSRYGRSELRIVLLQGVHPNAKPPIRAPTRSVVPDSIDEWHPLLAALKDPGAVFEVSTPLISRVLRFLHVLLTEAATRGYALRWSLDKKDGIVIVVEGREYCLTVSEETKKRDVLPTQEELADRKTYAWQRVQVETRMMPTGRLAVALFSSRWDRRNWADRKAWTIEDKLPAILAELRVEGAGRTRT